MQAKDWLTLYVEELHERADDRKKEGAPSAEVYARVADELEARRRAALYSVPTPAEASAESGYSQEQLRKLRKSGAWSGQRYDLPRRPGAVVPEARGLTLAQDIVRRRTG